MNSTDGSYQLEGDLLERNFESGNVEGNGGDDITENNEAKNPSNIQCGNAIFIDPNQGGVKVIEVVDDELDESENVVSVEVPVEQTGISENTKDGDLVRSRKDSSQANSFLSGSSASSKNEDLFESEKQNTKQKLNHEVQYDEEPSWSHPLRRCWKRRKRDVNVYCNLCSRHCCVTKYTSRKAGCVGNFCLQTVCGCFMCLCCIRDSIPFERTLEYFMMTMTLVLAHSAHYFFFTAYLLRLTYSGETKLRISEHIVMGVHFMTIIPTYITLICCCVGDCACPKISKRSFAAIPLALLTCYIYICAYVFSPEFYFKASTLIQILIIPSLYFIIHDYPCLLKFLWILPYVLILTLSFAFQVTYTLINNNDLILSPVDQVHTFALQFCVCIIISTFVFTYIFSTRIQYNVLVRNVKDFTKAVKARNFKQVEDLTKKKRRFLTTSGKQLQFLVKHVRALTAFVPTVNPHLEDSSSSDSLEDRRANHDKALAEFMAGEMQDLVRNPPGQSGELFPISGLPRSTDNNNSNNNSNNSSVQSSPGGSFQFNSLSSEEGSFPPTNIRITVTTPSTTSLSPRSTPNMSPASPDSDASYEEEYDEFSDSDIDCETDSDISNATVDTLTTNMTNSTVATEGMKKLRMDRKKILFANLGRRPDICRRSKVEKGEIEGMKYAIKTRYGTLVKFRINNWMHITMNNAAAAYFFYHAKFVRLVHEFTKELLGDVIEIRNDFIVCGWNLGIHSDATVHAHAAMGAITAFKVASKLNNYEGFIPKNGSVCKIPFSVRISVTTGEIVWGNMGEEDTIKSFNYFGSCCCRVHALNLYCSKAYSEGSDYSCSSRHVRSVILVDDESHSQTVGLFKTLFINVMKLGPTQPFSVYRIIGNEQMYEKTYEGGYKTASKYEKRREKSLSRKCIMALRLEKAFKDGNYHKARVLLDRINNLGTRDGRLYDDLSVLIRDKKKFTELTPVGT